MNGLIPDCMLSLFTNSNRNDSFGLKKKKKP